MSESRNPTMSELKAQRTELHQRLDELVAMNKDKYGIAGEGLRQLTNQLADLEEQLEMLQDKSPATTLNQQQHITHLYQIYQAAPGQATLTETEFQKVLADYLSWVYREYGYTRLFGLPTLPDINSLNKPLTQVYTSLTVRHRPPVPPDDQPPKPWRLKWSIPHTATMARKRQVDMGRLLALGDRVVISGGTGSGKTTYLSFVAASLAAALQGEPLDVRLKPPDQDKPFPVPILAPLRFWQVYRDACAQTSDSHLPSNLDEGSLAAFLLWFLQTRYQNFDAASDFFNRLLRGGQGCLILLDGLDKVGGLEERRMVRDEIVRLLDDQYPNNRCLVTVRQPGYQNAPFGSDFIHFDVLPMNNDQITGLVKAWGEQLYPQLDNREAAVNDLIQTITELNEQRLTREQVPLVTTPLLVTMMVSLKYRQRKPPSERAKIYDACIDLMLKSEDNDGVIGEATHQQRERLSLLAFQMHQAEASFGDPNLQAVLKSMWGEQEERMSGEELIQGTYRWDNLVEVQGNHFQFRHLMFQEYLAGSYLAREWPRLLQETPDLLAKLVIDERWREALLLTIGCLAPPVTYEKRLALIEALCKITDSFSVRLAAAELAGMGLVELNEPESHLRHMVQDRLVTLLNDPALPQASPTTRAAAGRALAILDDPRDFDELIEIPAGPFFMGSRDADEWADDDEKPQHVVDLPGFKIGRYPVTNGQYRKFVEATGQEWPTEDGRRPEKTNCPATNVSWYDARAYCIWLTDVWRAEGKIDPNEVVCLPTEAAWEKAARGVDSHLYPWGDEWGKTRANLPELGLHDTVPVGIFPDGASPYGCQDVIGNVWEWTGSLWGPWLAANRGNHLKFRYPYDPTDGRENLEAEDYVLRVIRGGSWDISKKLAHCACRYRNLPFRDHDLLGFRIVVVPLIST